ncbi:hypothetical protein GCM10023196_010480 [Actinoallomurus vinaceus]|uniref:Uncharacterized protein n=1 Tax=Actinoallomurus vinaceus TaxID=1080074 RepID=A0ABP8U3G5_9ACTN
MFRHRFDPSSLLAAALFLAVAYIYLAGSPPVWVAPGLVGALGVLALVRVMFRSRRREPTDPRNAWRLDARYGKGPER